MTETNKNNHGGKRPGAGRKPEGNEPKRQLPVKVNKETRDKVKNMADKYEVSQAYVVEQAVKKLRKIT